MNQGTPERPHCRICGYPLDRKNRTGLCSNRTPACRKARDHLTAEEKPGKFRITVKAGDIFALWAALEDYDHADLRVLCRCACGIERRVNGTQLTNGRTLSCGRCVKSRPRPPKEPYLKAGTTFGRLTLLEDVTYAHDRARWRCECGTEVQIDASSVKFGHSRSCGCLHRELMTKHGLSKHPLYDIWKGILARCINPNGQSYEGYGERGITICARWRDDVTAFIADIEREIGPRPEGKGKGGRALYEVDRTDNDGGYWCGHCGECIRNGWLLNVQWSTRPEQMQNRRKVPKLTRDVLRLTQERDAATQRENAPAARVAALEALLAPGQRKMPAATADITLF